ncbi:MAG: acylphosphatase [Gammaproteobacteria bacterium]|nr:acylphosphatase [Gammaproteobacteria bacterium]MDX5375650.1 acylphosphatase [Gammaproteobacteria bacterium]
MGTRDCRRFLVSGHVQGVFFRASTREQALALGLEGYARNLPDGRVEVVACGPVAALASLRDWLHQGPRLAEVTAVDESAAEAPGIAGFETR